MSRPPTEPRAWLRWKCSNALALSAPLRGSGSPVAEYLRLARVSDAGALSVNMDLEQALELAPRQAPKAPARLVSANYILAMSSRDLKQALATELAENPAIELVESPTWQVCRSDPLTKVASEQTQAERLLWVLGALLPEKDMTIAECLVNSLDERGYLSCSVDAVAYELELEAPRVAAVLKVLQSLEPVGIGARNLRERLLIQLDHLQQNGLEQPHTREIVSDYFTELDEHRFSRIADKLNMSDETVREAWAFVESKLNPHPAHGFTATNARDRDTRQMYILPDVIISREVDDLEVEVVESRRFTLRINPTYSHLHSDPHRSDKGCSPEESKLVQQYLGRAKLFMSRINQRRQMLYDLTSCLVDKQRGFLEQGVPHLEPLSRAVIAKELGVRESTVRRAMADKYVMTPDGAVIPFSHFFTPSLSIKDVVKELIEREGRWLTDAEIRDRLRETGVNIARRTVAKYRAQLDTRPRMLH